MSKRDTIPESLQAFIRDQSVFDESVPGTDPLYGDPEVRTLAKLTRSGETRSGKILERAIIEKLLGSAEYTVLAPNAYPVTKEADRRARAKARRGRRTLTLDDLCTEIRGDRPGLPPRVRHAVALHEAGHAVVATELGNLEVHSLSIDDRGGLMSGEIKLDTSTKSELLDHVVGLLAGRASEELFADVTLGSGGGGEASDLRRATEIVMALEARCGLGSLGLLALPSDRHPLELVPELAKTVSAILADCSRRATEILRRRREEVLAVAAELERRGSLDPEAVARILAAHPIRDGVEDAGPVPQA